MLFCPMNNFNAFTTLIKVIKVYNDFDEENSFIAARIEWMFVTALLYTVAVVNVDDSC